jgi:hypothetical protein
MPVNFDDLQAFLFLGMSVFIRNYRNSHGRRSDWYRDGAGKIELILEHFGIDIEPEAIIERNC